MGKHIKNIIDGVMQVLVLNPEVSYERPSRSDFSKDVKALSRDSKRVIQDLNKTAAKCGK